MGRKLGSQKYPECGFFATKVFWGFRTETTGLSPPVQHGNHTENIGISGYKKIREPLGKIYGNRS